MNSLELASWLDANPLIAWSLVTVGVLICLALVVWTFWLAFRHAQSIRRALHREEEQRKQEQRFLLQAWRAMLLGEEWELDVSELRKEVDALLIAQKIRRVLDRAQGRVVGATALLLLSGFLSQFFIILLNPAPWIVLLMAGVFIFLLALLGWQMFRYWQLKKKVLQLITEIGD